MRARVKEFKKKNEGLRILNSVILVILLLMVLLHFIFLLTLIFMLHRLLLVI